MKKSYRGLPLDEFQPGLSFESPSRTVTESDTVLFASLSGDFNPLHIDEEFAKNSAYGRRMAHGALVQALMTGLIAQLGIFEGTVVALRRLDTTFKRPVFLGDTLQASIKVEERRELRGRDDGIVVFSTKMANQQDQIVAEGKWVVVLKKAEK